MPNKRNIKLPTATKPAKPVNTAPLGTAAAAQAKRSNVAKPVADKPADAAAAPIPATAVAKPSRDVTRTAATIAKQATNFGSLSERDNAYIAFYAGFAKRDGTVTVAAIRDSGAVPNYAGSAKPHDAGVIVRLCKAGIVAASADGSSFTFTERGKALSAYASAAKR